MSHWSLFFDGGSRGNPGPAAYGWVLHSPDGEEAARGCEHIGSTTNNVAEYTGLVRGLEHAVGLGITGLDVRGDSELIVKQLNGIYRVKSKDLKPLYVRAKELLESLSPTTVSHVYRDHNAVADALVNEALDALL